MRTVSSQRGFTLVEAVIVIVITGIIATVVAVFIRTPVESYFDSVARAELSDAADTALRRMSRDLRLALPNSIRVSGSYIELLLTSDGGRYLDEADDLAGGNILDFNNAANTTFSIVGFPMPSIQQGNSIVVYNLGLGTSDAYCASTTACNNRAVVNGVAPGSITLAANPFSNALRSPSNRFQVVTTPVTYGCTGGTLTRYWGYPIATGQATPPTAAGVQSAVLARGVTGCTFSYTSQANVRAGLVGLGITMAGEGKAGTVTLFQQVHVDNTP